MKNIAIKISYKQSGVSSEIQKSIDNLKDELQILYILNVRPNAGPQAGNLLDTTLEIILDISLADLAKICRDGFIFDTIVRGKEMEFSLMEATFCKGSRRLAFDVVAV